MKFMEMLSKDLDYYGTLLKKLAPPLVTLLSAEPELQYVALRNINLIVQKRYRDQHPCMLHARDRDPQGKLICHCAGILKSTRGFSTRALSLQRTLDKKRPVPGQGVSVKKPWASLRADQKRQAQCCFILTLGDSESVESFRDIVRFCICAVCLGTKFIGLIEISEFGDLRDSNSERLDFISALRPGGRNRIEWATASFLLSG